MRHRLTFRAIAACAGLRCRLAVLVLLAVLPAVALAWHAASTERRLSSLELQRTALRAAHHVAAEQQAVVDGTRHLLTALSAVPGLSRGGDCAPLLRALTAEPAYAWMAVLDAQGRVLCGTPPSDTPYADKRWFAEAVTSGTGTVGGFEIGRASDMAVKVVALPLRGPDGTVDRVIAASIDLAWLGRELVAKEAPGVSVTLLDGTGRVLARHPESHWAGRLIDRYPAMQAAMAARDGMLEAASPRGDRRAYGFTQVSGTDARIIVGLPVTEAVAAVEKTFRLRLLAIAAAALLFLVLALAGARRLILRPLSRLTDAAQALSRGDLRARSNIAHGGDEIGALAAHFDGMAAAVEAMVAERTRGQAAALAVAEAANRAKTQFLAAASHDLRQPLQALNLYLHLLTGKLHDPKQIELARLLGNSADAARSLLDTLMGLSALETGQIQPDIQPVAVAPLLQRIADESRAEASAKGLSLRVRAIEAVTETDPVLLERMLRNLVKNALRYTARGRIVIAARPDGDGVRLEVWDTGPGIAPDKLQAIFQEFYRVPGTGTGERGLGLGLATVARMGKLLGLETGVRSRLGHGSVFFIRIPPAERRLAA